MSSATGTDGREVTMHGGGVARVRPDGSGLEVYSYFSRNQCDVAISPYLDQFVRDNTNDGKGWNIRVHHHSNLSNHGYPRLYKNFSDEGVKPLLDLGGGSGTGALYLHEPGFPDGFGDRLFTCDWTTGKIYHHELERFEATFEAKQEDWMELTRAIDIDVDGQSRLYTADWRGGRFVYAGEGVKVGLIHRVVPTGYVPEPWPNLNEMSTGDLVAQLAHRSAVRRLEAQQILVRKGDASGLAEALQTLISGEAPLYGKVAAIFAYKQIFGKESEAVLVALLEEPELREFAIRALGDDRKQVAELTKELLTVLLEDKDPRVRLQTVVAIERGARVDLAAEVLASSAESFNGLSKLEGLQDYRLPHVAVEALAFMNAEEACLSAIADPHLRGVALGALKKMSSASVVTGLEKALAQAGDDAELQLQLLEVLARLVNREAVWDEASWWSTRPDDRGPYFELARWEESDRIIKILETIFKKLTGSHAERALALMSENRLDVTQMDLGGLDPVLMALGAASASVEQLIVLRQAALDSERKWEQRLAAYRAITRSIELPALEEQMQVLAGWSEEESLNDVAEREVNEFINSPALILRLRDLRKIGAAAEPGVSKIAWKAILTFSRSPLVKVRQAAAAKQAALDNPRALGYFHALAEMKLSGFEAPIENALNGDNTKLIEAAQAAKIAIEKAASQATGALVATLDPAEVTAELMSLAGQGDIELGKKLYTQQACASCHAVDLAEVQKGPYLGSAGSKFTRDYLIESILAPGATVAQGFRTQMITMQDGTVHMGFVTREEDGQVDVRNIGGVVVTVDNAEIASRVEQTQSMMPAGLGSTLTVSQFNSLIDYLASLKEG